ncbi:MAG TPA: LLM class flavin-dependent oxidoreductase [Pseudonocardiaceae bacterium]|nr:LLM class flavin-dependent oxidoreductase [Pseudonocardiaceae bacterium]
MTLRRAVAAPCFADDPMALVTLAVEAEATGFDGFFIWDHMVFANDGMGPSIVDPWAVLSVAAAHTTSIVLGPMITPVPRRRPWVLARQTVTLDRIAGGRTVFGVGIGSPAHGDFGIFGDETDARTRAAMLDEGLAVLDGLWTGEPFEFHGEHYSIEPVRFRPTPAAPIRVWVGGVLPNVAPMRRAARWDGAVPIRFARGALARPSAADIAGVRDTVAERRGSLANYDLVVWAEVTPDPVALPDELPSYVDAGATWWIETAKPEPNWYEGLRRRIAAGPTG